MITIVSKSKRKKIIECIELCNGILKDDRFYDEIKLKSGFDMTEATPTQVADYMKDSDVIFMVKFFKPRGLRKRLKYRKTNAYTNKKYPNQLFLNTRKLNRSKERISATIIHESVHAVDNQVKEFDFGHGDNDSTGKGNTAPYWIGRLAYKYLKRNNTLEAINFSGIKTIDSLENPLELDF